RRAGGGAVDDRGGLVPRAAGGAFGHRPRVVGRVQPGPGSQAVGRLRELRGVESVAVLRTHGPAEQRHFIRIPIAVGVGVVELVDVEVGGFRLDRRFLHVEVVGLRIAVAEHVAVCGVVRLARDPGLVDAAVVGRVVEGDHLHAHAAAIAGDDRVVVRAGDHAVRHGEFALGDRVAAQHHGAGRVGDLEDVHAVVQRGRGAVGVVGAAAEVDVGLRVVVVDVDGAVDVGGEEGAVDGGGERS